MSRARLWRRLVVGLGLVILAMGLGGDGRAQTYAWSVPVNLGPVINSSDSNEDLPHISRDGLSLYFISNRTPGAPDDFDIWVSHRDPSDDRWGRAVKLGPDINKPGFNNRGPCLSADGHHLFFSSNRADRPPGFGSQDIWVSSREDTSDDFGWQPPLHLGSTVNTIDADFGAALLEDENGAVSALLFGRRVNGGDSDIYMSERLPNGPFSQFGPAAVVAALSTKFDDLRPTIRPDGLELFFNSNRAGSQKNGSLNSNDLWVSSRPNLSSPWSTPANVGRRINTQFEEQFPALSADGNTLIFSSNRLTGADNDLYVSTLVPEGHSFPWP